MDFIGFFDLAFVGLADGQKLIYFFNFLFSLYFEITIFLVDDHYCVLNLAYLMTFVLLCVLIDALHAHYFLFLLAEKNEILFMHVALGCKAVFCTRTVFG